MSFLKNITSCLNIKSESDVVLKEISKKIEPKCEIIHFPINFQRMPKRINENYTDELHLIWPHRWEHDKNPEMLVEVILELQR